MAGDHQGWGLRQHRAGAVRLLAAGSAVVGSRQLPKFIDANTYEVSGGGYIVTNEEPETFNELIGSQTFERGGGICSGGEMGLFVLLPRCKEVVLVDHGYAALAAAYCKAMLLSALGPRGVAALFCNGNAQAVNEALEPLLGEMPEALRRRITRLPNDSACYYAHPFNTHNQVLFAREFNYATGPHAAEGKDFSLLEKASERIGSLTLVHGDLTDLRAYGPFDALYVSNAMEHSGRSGAAPKLEDLEPLVSPGGTLLGTGSSGFTYYQYSAIDPHNYSAGKYINLWEGKWDHVASRNGHRSTGWEHRVLRRKADGV